MLNYLFCLLILIICPTCGQLTASTCSKDDGHDIVNSKLDFIMSHTDDKQQVQDYNDLVLSKLDFLINQMKEMEQGKKKNLLYV